MTKGKRAPEDGPQPSVGDVFMQKLAERRAELEQEAEPAEMEFDGIPCRVRPVSLHFFIRSGRMPSYLSRIVLSGGAPGVTHAATQNLTDEQILDGQAFQRAAVCHVLAEPRVYDAPEGEAPADALSYMKVAESVPRFVDEVFRWVLRGCPVPRKEGGEGEGLQAPDLETFPDGGGRPERARTRAARKGGRKKAVGAAAAGRVGGARA